MVTTEMTASAAAGTEAPDPRFFGWPGEEQDTRFYRKMFFIRRFEETVLALFEERLLAGTTHAYIGQEADAVGVLEHLRASDHVFSNHRCHGHYLARTGDAFGLLAEMMGKAAGVCRGRGGSQHICAAGFKANGILGGTLPAAAGIAMAEQLRGTDNLSVVFIGDGAMGEGVVYETLNLTALWSLPLFVIMENNSWAQSTPIRMNLAGGMVLRFQAFGLPVREITTTDVREVYRVAGEEITMGREQRVPRVLIINTYRLCPHSKNDDNRPEEEVRARWETEPLRVHGARLTPAVRATVEHEVEAALREVVTRARNLP